MCCSKITTMKVAAISVAVASMLCFFLLAACGGGGGGSSSIASAIKVIANVSNDFAIPTVGVPNIGTTVDQIIAIPSSKGDVSTANIAQVLTAPVGTDGSFELSLDKSHEWILMIDNSQAATIDDKITTYVAAAVDSSSSLMAFAGSTLSSTLDLGNLNKSGNEARGDKNTSSSYNVSQEQLVAMSRSDSGYKHTVNNYRNYNSATDTYYRIGLEYGYNSATIASVGNSDPVGSDVDSYVLSGFSLWLNTNNRTAPTPDDVCSLGRSVTLYPPSTISDGVDIWDAVTGFTNDASGAGSNLGGSGPWPSDEGTHTYCYDDDFGLQYYPGSTEVVYQFGTRNGLLHVPVAGMPTGLWKFDLDGTTTLGTFDLAVGSPLNNGKFDTTPIPAIKLVHDAGGAISSMEIRWFVYDPVTVQYLELNASQVTAVEKLVKEVVLTVQDEDGPFPATPGLVWLNAGGPLYVDGLSDGSEMIFPSSGSLWYLPGSAGDVNGNLVPTNISIQLSVAGIMHSFSWH